MRLKRTAKGNGEDLKIRTYPASFVMELFDITRQQLYYWRKNLLTARGMGTGNETRYSFEDLVAIRTILKLREEGVSTHMITRVIKKSRELFPDMENLLSSTPVIPSGGRLIVIHRGQAYEGTTGQGVFISLMEVEQEVEESIREKLRISA
jgi:DNA-binding transcriptional MerR regulator